MLRFTRPIGAPKMSLATRRRWFADVEASPASTESSETTAQPINWSSVDPATIPADVVRRHAAYKELLDESVQRRQENAKLKAAAPVPVSDAATPPAAPLAELMQRLQQLEARQTDTTRALTLERVQKEHRLRPEQAQYIAGNTYEEMTHSAKSLAAAFGVPAFPNTPTGSGGTPDSHKQLLDSVMNNLGIGDTKRTSIFDVGVQKQYGGGITRKEGN